MTEEKLITVDGQPIHLRASSAVGLETMESSIEYLDRTPEQIVAAFEPYDHFHATLTSHEE